MYARTPKTLTLLDHLGAMGGQVELALQWAAEVLHRPTHSYADKIAALDQQIDLAEHKIYDTSMILAQQPDAIPASFALARFALHLERIGDYAKNIIQRSTALDHDQLPSIQGSVWRMAQTAQRNLQFLLNAILQQNVELARQAWHADADLDAHYTAVVMELLPVLGQRPQAVVTATHLWFIARNLERIGDHQSNMAEALYYWLKGERLNEQRRFYDPTATVTSPVQTPLDGAANINSNVPPVTRTVLKTG